MYMLMFSKIAEGGLRDRHDDICRGSEKIAKGATTASCPGACTMTGLLFRNLNYKLPYSLNHIIYQIPRL